MLNLLLLPLSDVTLPAMLAWRTERRHYLDLVRPKRKAFWATRVDVEQHQPCRLWRSFDQLLGRGRTPLADIDATVLHRFFDDKVAGFRAATAGAAEPQFTAAPVGCELRLFTPVTQTDVIEMVHASTARQVLLRFTADVYTKAEH